MDTNTSFPSPDRRYRLDIFPQEMRMSHTVDCPYLIDNQTNDCLLELGGLWDASNVKWSRNSLALSMNLRHYPDGSVVFLFVVDMVAGTAQLSSADYGVLLTGTMAGVVAELQRTISLRTIFQ
jgi:hypothetical protein